MVSIGKIVLARIGTKTTWWKEQKRLLTGKQFILCPLENGSVALSRCRKSYAIDMSARILDGLSASFMVALTAGFDVKFAGIGIGNTYSNVVIAI